MFRELLVPTMLSQVRFYLKTNLAKRHINVGHCSLLGKKIFNHFSDRVTVAWRHQTMTSHLSLHTASFKHHCKIRKCLLCTLYKFYMIPSYIQRDMRVVSELFYPPTYILYNDKRACMVCKIYIEKKKRSDSVPCQKPLHPTENPKSNAATQKRLQNFDYTTIADRLSYNSFI